LRPLLILPWLFLFSASAQPVEGVVKAQERPLPGAVVVVRHGGLPFETATDEQGRFRLAGIAAGPVDLEISLFGFETVKRSLAAVERSAPLDIELTLRRRAVSAPAAAAPAETPESQEENSEAVLVQGSVAREVELPNFGEFGPPAGQFVPPPVPGMAMGMEAPPGMAPAEAMPGVPGAAGRTAGEAAGRAQAAAGAELAKRLRQMTPKQRKELAGVLAKRARRPAGRAPAGFQALGNRRRSLKDQLRGGAFFSMRDALFDAAPYAVNGRAMEKPDYTQKRFGFTFGGPVLIPGLRALERANFFLNYTGVRARNPFTSFGILPEAPMRAGDFSALANVLYDPAGNLPLAGNHVPESRIGTAARGLLKLIPAANQAGAVQNYRLVDTVPQTSDNWSVRWNQPLPKRHRLSINLAWQSRRGEALQAYGFRDPNGGAGRNLDVQWMHNKNARLIWSARARYNLNRNEVSPFFAFRDDLSGRLGIAGNSRDPANWGPPTLNFTNYTDLQDGNPLQRNLHTWVYALDAAFVRKKHSLKGGLELQRLQWNNVGELNPRGTLFFGGLLTSRRDARGQAVAGTGHDFADFLLGLPQQASLRSGAADTYLRATQYALFAQDEWRVRSNLTVNAGLRYELFAPYDEKYSRRANLDVAPGFTGVAVVTPGAPGPYSGRFAQALIDTDWNNLSPRVGVAWRPWDKRRTALRFGYSVFFDGSVYQRLPTRLAAQPPFAKTSNFQSSPSLVLTTENPFIGPQNVSVRNTYAVDRYYLVPYVQAWSSSLEQPLARGFVLELGYQGSKGTRLVIQRSPNRAPPGGSLTAEERRRIGNASGFTFDSTEGNSVYHGLQVRFARRMQRGFSWQSQYVWSKSIDNASTIGGAGSTVAQDDRNLALERGLSAFDRRHALTFNTMASAPWRNRWLRDWSLTASLTAQTGAPLTARVLGQAADAAGSGATGSGRADSTGASIAPRHAGEPFNLAAFRLPAPGFFGTAGRNTIPGPGTLLLNSTFGRAFSLREGSRFRLDLRLEGNNVLNKVNIVTFGAVVNAYNYGLASNSGPMRSLFFTARLRF
jgi:hypothetical protein